MADFALGLFTGFVVTIILLYIIAGVIFWRLK